MKQIGKIAFAVAAAVVASTTWAKSYKLTVTSTSTSRGTVSGGGTYKNGTIVTVTAKAKGSYVFGGWFSDKACTQAAPDVIYKGNYLDPKVKVKVYKNAKMYAKFITKAEDKKALKLTGLKKYENTAYEGTYYFASLSTGASYLSKSTLKFKNLPKGLRVLGNEAIEGFPTVPGKYTVTATLTSAAGNTVTQKFKIYVKVMEWARGTLNGYAFPDGGNKPGGYLTFTINTAGKVSGKVNYKNKEYPFTTKCTYCTEDEARFTPPSIKLGSKTLDPGVVTVVPEVHKFPDEGVVAAANVNSTYVAQKKLTLVDDDGHLAELNGRSFSFSKKDSGSGLKAGDSLKVLLKNNVAKISGSFGGKSLSVGSVPLYFTSKDVSDEGATYVFCVYIYDSKAGYRRWLFFTVDAEDGLGGDVRSVTTRFIK